MSRPDEAQAAILEIDGPQHTTTASISTASIRAVTDCLRFTEAAHTERLIDTAMLRLELTREEAEQRAVLTDLVSSVIEQAKKDVERRLPLDILLSLIPRIQHAHRASTQEGKT